MSDEPTPHQQPPTPAPAVPAAAPVSTARENGPWKIVAITALALLAVLAIVAAVATWPDERLSGPEYEQAVQAAHSRAIRIATADPDAASVREAMQVLVTDLEQLRPPRRVQGTHDRMVQVYVEHQDALPAMVGVATRLAERGPSASVGTAVDAWRGVRAAAQAREALVELRRVEAEFARRDLDVATLARPGTWLLG
jgi:hypothetical protein